MKSRCMRRWNSCRLLLTVASCSALLDVAICTTKVGANVIRRVMKGGHQDAINCLDATPGSSTLFSGSDDGSVRVWDVRALRCVMGMDGCPGPVNSLAVSAACDHLLYTASGHSILLFDLRMPSALALKPDTRQLTATSEYRLWSQDISQISLHPSGSHLAAVDEGGSVSILDCNHPDGDKRVRRLASGHEALASCICWRGSVRGPPNLLTGGFDMKILMHHLDERFERESQAPVTLTMQDPVGEQPSRRRTRSRQSGKCTTASGFANTEGLPMINPPFVHALELTSDGQTLAVACGDGSLRKYILKMDGPVQVVQSSIYRGHRHRTTCLALPRSSGQNRCFTGSDDRSLLLWNINAQPSDDDAVLLRIDHGFKPYGTPGRLAPPPLRFPFANQRPTGTSASL